MGYDMYKVIVELPRKGSRLTNASDGRIFRSTEEVTSKIGIKRGHLDRKYLNENLPPLRRFLASQVGRPWNKVYAELSRKGVLARRVVISADIELRRIEELWFEIDYIEFAAMPSGQTEMVCPTRVCSGGGAIRSTPGGQNNIGKSHQRSFPLF
jgi:hypothetical protein